MKITSLYTSMMAAILAVQMNGRILTPNGDGIHDSVGFSLMAPAAHAVHGQVFDVRGRRMSDLISVSSTEWRWDGRDFAGRIVESGIYLVQIHDDETIWNGVVAVTK